MIGGGEGSGPGREHEMARTFVRLADTLAAGFDPAEYFDDLAHSLVSLCDLEAAGVMLVDSTGALRLMASSSDRSRVVELFELQSDEGPCLDAFRTGEPIQAETPTELQVRWPNLAPEVSRAGLGPAYGLPLRRHDQTIGAVNLFRPPGQPLAGDAAATARALIDVATIATLQARSTTASMQLAEQLQAALDSRVVIEQAKGILAAHGRLEMQTAFDLLRGYARRHNMRLAEVAEAVALGRLHPRDILEG